MKAIRFCRVATLYVPVTVAALSISEPTSTRQQLAALACRPTIMCRSTRSECNRSQQEQGKDASHVAKEC